MSIDWNSVIDDDGITTLEPGEYAFRVKGYTKSLTQAGDPMAKVNLIISSPRGETEVMDNIVLKETTVWKISSFFRSVGMKKHGQPMKIDFDGAIGKSGRLTLYIDEYTTKNGRTIKTNRVDEYLDPVDDLVIDDDFSLMDEEVPF